MEEEQTAVGKDDATHRDDPNKITLQDVIPLVGQFLASVVMSAFNFIFLVEKIKSYNPIICCL